MNVGGKRHIGLAAECCFPRFQRSRPMKDRLTDVKLVIVDDDPDIWDSMQAAFEAEGAVGVPAWDVNEGWDA